MTSVSSDFPQVIPLGAQSNFNDQNKQLSMFILAKQDPQLATVGHCISKLASVDSETVQHKLVRDIIYKDATCLSKSEDELVISLVGGQDLEFPIQSAEHNTAPNIQDKFPQATGSAALNSSISVLPEFEDLQDRNSGRIVQTPVMKCPISLSHIPYLPVSGTSCAHLAPTVTVTFGRHSDKCLPKSADKAIGELPGYPQKALLSQSFGFLRGCSPNQQDGAVEWSEIELSPKILAEAKEFVLFTEFRFNKVSVVCDDPRVKQCRLNLQRIECNRRSGSASN